MDSQRTDGPGTIPSPERARKQRKATLPARRQAGDTTTSRAGSKTEMLQDEQLRYREGRLLVFTVFLKLNKCLSGDGYLFHFSVCFIYRFITMCIICTARCILFPSSFEV